MSTAVPQNPTANHVASLLPKLSDADADLRYMALNDLYNILNFGHQGFLLNDYTTCCRAVDGLLKTLDDTNGEVQNQAIKCVGPLALQVHPEILPTFVEKLSLIKTENSVDNSIPATALRAFVVSFPPPISGLTSSKATQDAYATISKVLIPRLLGYVVIPLGLKGHPPPPTGMLEFDSENGVDSDAIDVLSEVVRCFGSMLQEPEKQALLRSISEILDNGRTGTVTKKKAVMAISILAVYLSDPLLSNFVSTTIESFRDPHLTPSKRRLLITMIGSLTRTVPQRLGPYLKTLAPFVLSALSAEEYDESMADLAEEGTSNPEVEEVREAALVALEGFLLSCSNEMRRFTDEVIDSVLRYVTYDPNFALDEDDEEMGGTQGDDDDDEASTNGIDDAEEDFEEEENMSDDDDASWKVRRCAAKALYTIISTRSSGDLLDNGVLYDKIAPVLISRFQEREENVRLEILTTLASLIRKTEEGPSIINPGSEGNGYVSAFPISHSRKRRRGSSDAIAYDSAVGMTSPIDSPSPISGPRADLARLGPVIVQAVAKLLKQSSIPTKHAAITLLRDIVVVQHGGLSEHLNKIADPLIDAFAGSSTQPSGHTTTLGGGAASAIGSSLRINALQLVSAICDTHSASVISPYIEKLVTGIVSAVKDRYYKISGEAIIVVESVIKVLTPPRISGTDQQRQAYLSNLYDVILERAVANDADLEVRQRAIHALGVLLARTAGSSSGKLLPASKKSKALNVLLDRLKNEITRLPAVRAIDIVAASAADKDELKATWVREVTIELGAQLRKADRTLRGASLAALKNMVTNSSALASLDDTTIKGLVGMLLPLLDETELNLLGLALLILTKLVQRSPKKVVNSDLDDVLCTIVLAPLAGGVLDAFLGLIKTIGEHGVGQSLMNGLLKNVGVAGDPALVGKAIGTLLISGGSTVGVKIEDFVTELQSAPDDQRKCLALSILGEAGLRLGSSSPLQPDLFITHFKSKSEQVPRAAAIALGRAGAGNINQYLPIILSTTNKSGSSQYLLLHSIKEILQHVGKAGTDISAYTAGIWDKLLTASQAEDNKAVGAECIGRLAIIEPKKYLPLLKNYLQDPAPAVRGMGIQAVRFTLAENDETFDDVLKPMLIQMLSVMLKDPHLENRRLALSALNSATHNKPDIILPHLAQLLPLVIQESKIKPELVREVQMGPFKHKVDDGLEVRKSAYETLYALMESAFTRINPLELFDRVIAGLEDEHDIKVLCNLMLTKYLLLDPAETVRRLDQIAECFRVILSFKPKDNAVKQEVEKAQEASKSVLRVTVLLHNAFPGAAGSPANGRGQVWKGYWEWLGKDFRTQLQAMEQEVKNEAV